jgi:hypothetical protein
MIAHNLYLCNQPWTQNTLTINSHKFFEQKHEFSNAIYVIDLYQNAGILLTFGVWK